MQKSKLNLRIDIIHFEDSEKIELRYPASTARLWRVVTVLVEHYLDLAEVKVILREHPQTAAEWRTVQKVLARLAASRRHTRITIDEAQHSADLFCMLCLHMRQPEPWKWSRTLLQVWAQIARYLFTPTPSIRLCKRADAIDLAIRCYEGSRKKVGVQPAWLTLQEIHDFWLELTKYKGTDERILEIERRLNGLSRLYRMALETTVTD